jgi:copper chaperone CopZ
VRAIFTALAGVEGVTRADVGIGFADVEHDGSVTVEQLREAIDVAGYQVVGEEPRSRRSLPLA